MSKDSKLEALRQKIAFVASKSKKLEDALNNHKAVPERGDVYLFKLENVPEDVGVFWVVVNRHPDDPELIFAVPADTNTLIGSFDVPIPESALFGPLTLRLGRGLWLMETTFDPSLRVGMIESLFMDRAQFIMSRIARCEWIGSEMQQATDANPDYEEWIEMLDQAYVAMRTYRENQLIRVYTYQQIVEGIRSYVSKAREWLIDLSDEGLRKLHELLIPPILEPLVLRGGAVNHSASEQERIYLEDLKKKAPFLPVDCRLRGKVLKIDFLWREQPPAIAPVVSATLKGIAILPEDVSWESWDGKIQVLKIRNCTVLKREKEQAKSLIRVRTDGQTLYIDILQEQKDPE